MKKIYKTLMALAAAMLLPLSVTAQTNHEKYEFDEEKGIGYNKYLVSDTPNENGEYTLRIENFICGDVKEYAVPTDFVLILDNSGSMMYEHRYPYTAPLYISLDNTVDGKSNYLIQDPGWDGRDKLAYSTIYKTGSYNTKGGGTSITGAAFQNLNGTGGYHSLYYKYVDNDNAANSGFYRIYHLQVTYEGTKYYNLAIKLNNGTVKYLWGTGIHDDANHDVTADNYIIYTGEFWRPLRRGEALKNAVEAFVNTIKVENEKDQWAKDKNGNPVTKHQVAIVAFGSGYPNGKFADAMVESTTMSSNSKLVKDFAEANEPSVFVNAMNASMQFSGSTYIDLGVTIGRALFERLQDEDGMGPVNRTMGPNRNKVAIVLTDGEPSSKSTASGYSGNMGNIKEALFEARKIKAQRTKYSDTAIHGVVYGIDLFCDPKSVAFLEHLSSDYPDGDNTNTSGSWVATGYTGTQKSTDYYQDARVMDLSEVFKNIAAANTGASTKAMVAVDVMSDSFLIPFTTEDTDKVKMYTAQCIGFKTFDDEPDKQYLAFAEPIQVKNREPLQELWVVRTREEGGETISEWVNLAADNDIDIDNRMSFVVSEDENGVGKSITVKGFNYADLWCGLDPDLENHHNTRQMASTDPNAEYAKPGYRGFKMIFEFPFKVDPNALGGVDVPTNDWAHSGLYNSDDQGNPSGDPNINYPTPDLPVPVKLVIQKTGLLNGESANFTVQRRLRTDTAGEYLDFTTFVLTGGDTTPEVRIINLDPAYYYKVKEGNWSWAYENVSSEYYSTDPEDAHAATTNPIVFKNEQEDDTPKHAEAKATNIMKTTGSSTTPGEND